MATTFRRLFYPNGSPVSSAMENVYKPPVNRSMKNLDRDFFHKKVLTSVATIFDTRNVGPIAQKLLNNHGTFPLRKPVMKDPAIPGCKCIILSPDIKATHPETWTPTIADLVEKKLGTIKPYTVELTYDDWSTHEILEATLPLEDQDETPTGFAQAGHIAHLNLREPYLPYKHLIGQILLSKVPKLRTVINKVEDVGLDNPYRTFRYEILAGLDDMDVTVSENGCTFSFNFARVYWNSRLDTEHRRLISKFKEGEAVCDVMAGVGPFAVPAGKQHVFVWANDLNPESHGALLDAIKRNGVAGFVRPFCLDGREMIRRSAAELPMVRRRVNTGKGPTARRLARKPPSSVKRFDRQPLPGKEILEPKVFSHYVMNLPASAVEFLDVFRGLFAGRRDEFESEQALPIIHVYCFSQRRERKEDEVKDVCALVSAHLGAVIEPSDPEVEIHDVRLVSPQKKMFCASFKLPAEVAFAER